LLFVWGKADPENKHYRQLRWSLAVRKVLLRRIKQRERLKAIRRWQAWKRLRAWHRRRGR
jgi:hypothetical protein